MPEEHQKIVENENNEERLHYYDLLWEIGAAQTDGANLTAANIEWDKRSLSYRRQKTGELCVLQIGPRLEALLRKLPAQGPLFPTISKIRDVWRAAEFHRRCGLLKIEGVTLHSYRYAWACWLGALCKMGILTKIQAGSPRVWAANYRFNFADKV
jgi:integrase